MIKIAWRSTCGPPYRKLSVVRNQFANLSSVTGTTKPIVIKEGWIQADLDASMAKGYKKELKSDHDLSIEVFDLFAKTIAKERKARHDVKVAKYNETPPAERIFPDPPPSGITILDPTGGNGVRALRYMREVQDLRHIIVNDGTLSRRDALVHNMKLNGIPPELVTITPHFIDRVLHECGENDVVDLHSMGDLSPYLDAAVQAVSIDGGLLCVSSTNIQALAANASEACFGRYGCVPVRTHFGKEMSLRILLHAIDTSANRHKRSIQPWLSLCNEDHVRIFVRVRKTTSSGSLITMQNRVMLHYSTLCHSFFLQRLSAKNRLENTSWPVKATDSSQVEEETKKSSDSVDPLDALFGLEASAHDAKIDALFDSPDLEPASTQSNRSKTHKGRSSPSVFDLPELTGVPARHWQTGGPFWGGPLHDQEVVEALLSKFKSYDYQRIRSKRPVRTPDTTREQLALLTMVCDELNDVPFSYDLHSMCAILQCNLPSIMEMMSAIQNAGYRVSNFHADQQAIKTDAPSAVMWDIMKVHSASRPSISKTKNFSGQHILDRAPVLTEEVCFDLTKDVKKRARELKKY